MIETGQVVDIKTTKKSLENSQNLAVVKFERKSACGKCGMCFFKDNEMSINIEVENEYNAEIGDIVEIEMKDNIVIKSALIAYVLPLFFAFLGILIGVAFSNELLQIFLCLTFLIVGYTVVMIIDKKLKLTKKINPKMIGVSTAQNIKK